MEPELSKKDPTPLYSSKNLEKEMSVYEEMLTKSNTHLIFNIFVNILNLKCKQTSRIMYIVHNPENCNAHAWPPESCRASHLVCYGYGNREKGGGVYDKYVFV